MDFNEYTRSFHAGHDRYPTHAEKVGEGLRRRRLDRAAVESIGRQFEAFTIRREKQRRAEAARGNVEEGA